MCNYVIEQGEHCPGNALEMSLSYNLKLAFIDLFRYMKNIQASKPCPREIRIWHGMFLIVLGLPAMVYQNIEGHGIAFIANFDIDSKT